MIEVVSFGGGVQSTALALLVMRQDPRLLRVVPRLPDVFLFADVGDEPQAVYSHIDRMRLLMESAGLTLHVVRRDESLQEHVRRKVAAGESGVSIPPVYVPRRDRPGRMPVRRGCTRDFKVRVMDRWVRNQWPGRSKVGRWLGISFDEIQRMKADDGRWVYRHPLVEMGWRRTDCLSYLAECGITAPRSACIFCPFRSNAQWREIRKDPEEWAAVLAFEQFLREQHVKNGGTAGLEGDPTLHPDGPIGEVDLDAQTHLFSFDDECAGVCGV